MKMPFLTFDLILKILKVSVEQSLISEMIYYVLSGTLNSTH